MSPSSLKAFPGQQERSLPLPGTARDTALSCSRRGARECAVFAGVKVEGPSRVNTSFIEL